MQDLIKNILDQGLSMVSTERFNTIVRHYDNINSISGDIIECGVWAGGMSIFLAKLFKDRNIWVADSFDGFQPLENATYEYSQETHTPNYGSHIKVGIEIVTNNFKKFDLEVDNKRIKFLPGFVKDTLPKAKIKKIALLRIDVDAYSATREILDTLYDKVQIGGYIIFDDSCLAPTIDAVCDFFEAKNIKFNLYHPETDEIILEPRRHNLPCGCYLIKQN